MTQRLRSYVVKLIKGVRTYIIGVWRKNRFGKFKILLTILLAITLVSMYGISRWYVHTQADKPLVLGTSFIPAYAESFGLDPKDTMDALINDLGFRQFRLVSYWNQLEPEQGRYDFSLLDWQFEKAEASGSKVSLSLGLRQPRWPECHMPDWAKGMPESQWQPLLEKFMAETVNRYKDSPALDSYQVENEFFLMGFGICTNHNRDRLVSEYNLVKRLDSDHTVIINRSNNALGWPIGEPTPDKFGISIYKRVWDAGLTKRYLEYPFPAWFYGTIAGWQKIVTGRDMIIHELQAEAWPPKFQNIKDVSLAEQDKSFSPEMFEKRVKFGTDTGMREIYLWGSEYWYYRKVIMKEPSMWNAALKTLNTRR